MHQKAQHQVEPLEVHPFYGRQATEARGFLRLASKLLPLHTLTPVLTEWKFTWVRMKSWRAAAKYADLTNQFVNLGCGRSAQLGTSNDSSESKWINIDAFPAPGVDCLFDCRKQLPFADNTAKGIYTEHFFEHIDYTEEVPHFLSECHRVLQKSGVLRIVVPDAEKYVRAYCDVGWDAVSQVRGLSDDHFDHYVDSHYNTKMELLNEVFRQAFEHKFAYDFETLEFLLLKYGFSRIVHQDYGRSLLEELAIDQERRKSESLYVEAVK